MNRQAVIAAARVLCTLLPSYHMAGKRKKPCNACLTNVLSILAEYQAASKVDADA